MSKDAKAAMLEKTTSKIKTQPVYANNDNYTSVKKCKSFKEIRQDYEYQQDVEKARKAYTKSMYDLRMNRSRKYKSDGSLGFAEWLERQYDFCLKDFERRLKAIQQFHMEKHGVMNTYE